MAESTAAACGKQYPYEVWQQIKGSHFSCFSDYIALWNNFGNNQPSKNLSMESSLFQRLIVELLPTSAQCATVAVLVTRPAAQ